MEATWASGNVGSRSVGTVAEVFTRLGRVLTSLGTNGVVGPAIDHAVPTGPSALRENLASRVDEDIDARAVHGLEADQRGPGQGQVANGHSPHAGVRVVIEPAGDGRVNLLAEGDPEHEPLDADVVDPLELSPLLGDRGE